MKWLFFAIKNVLRNGRRSLLTVLLTAVGSAAILIGGGFALFTYEALREASVRDTGHLIVAHHDFFTNDEELPMQHGLGGHAEVAARLAAIPRVRAVLPRLQLSGLITNGDKSAVFVGTGIDAGGEFAVRGALFTVTEGSTLSTEPSVGGMPEIMLGKDLARQLRVRPGGSLTLLATTTEGALNAQDVVVKGVFSAGTPEIDKRAVLMHLGTAQKLILTDKVSTLAVYLRETADTEPMRGVVATELPSYARQTWRDQATFYVGVRGLYDRIFGLLGAVLVAMVLFAVSNTLGMAVVERTREIGTLRALGAFPADVVRNFVLEGAVVGAAGAGFGMALALGVSLGVDFVGVSMPPPPGRSVGYPLHVEVSPPLYVMTAIVVVGASVIAAWLVSRRAAAKSIVEALIHV